MTPAFTQDWFTPHIPVWERICQPLKKSIHTALEIGCFEGRATRWILIFLEATVVAVDTFEGNPEHPAMGVDFNGVKARFLQNVEPWKRRVQFYEETSQEFFRNYGDGFNFGMFDLVYIDGSHATADVLHDAVNSFTRLNTGGILIFDDYEWNQIMVPKPLPLQAPHMAIDAFLACYEGRYKLLHKGYQVIIRKV